MTPSATAPPAGVLLAAGGGQRFGGPKALARLDGRLLVEIGASVLTAGGCDPVIVVLGARAEQVRRDADLAGAVVVDNPDWTEGMGSSLRVGLGAAAAAGVDAVVVSLADQPRLGPDAIARLQRAWAGGALLAVATYAGGRGHPVLIDRTLWPAARRHAHGDVGLRGLMQQRPELVTPVPCDGTGSPVDVDTPAALAALTRREEP